MHVISRSALTAYAAKNAQAAQELDGWYYDLKAARWQNINELKQKFPSADLIAGNRFIFNVKGNHYRILAIVQFQTQRVYIRGIFTHAEYSKLSKKELLTL